MEEPRKRKSRMFFFINSLCFIVGQVGILFINKWSFVAAWSLCCHEWYIQILVWMHLLVGADCIVMFINYNFKKEDDKQED